MTPDSLDARPDFDPEDVWSINRFTSARNALKFYRVMAIITGVMLLILTAEVIYKYLVVGLLLHGDLATTLMLGSFDLGTAIAICHGWCYVVYLVACFWLNSQMKWTIGRFLILALAGVVPVMSFILEKRIHVQGEQTLEDAVVVAPKS